MNHQMTNPLTETYNSAENIYAISEKSNHLNDDTKVEKIEVTVNYTKNNGR